jgi:hypothetical protein
MTQNNLSGNTLIINCFIGVMTRTTGGFFRNLLPEKGNLAVNFISTIFIFVLSILILPCYAKTETLTHKNTQTHDFTDNFSEYQLNTKNCIKNASFNFLYDNLKQCHSHQFISKKPINTNSLKNKIHNRFRLTVYAYNNNDSAIAKIQTLLAQSHSDMGLTYRWDYVTRINNKIYWLNAACLFSEKNWHKLIVTLSRSLNPSPDTINETLQTDSGLLKSFICRCGAGCRPFVSKAIPY